MIFNNLIALFWFASLCIQTAQCFVHETISASQRTGKVTIDRGLVKAIRVNQFAAHRLSVGGNDQEDSDNNINNNDNKMVDIATYLSSEFENTASVNGSAVETIIIVTENPVGNEQVMARLQAAVNRCLGKVQLPVPEWLFPALATGAVKAAAESMSSTDFKLPKMQSTTAGDSGGSVSFVKLVIGVLPTAASRHNSPARTHSVNGLLKSHKGGSGDIAVMLLSTSMEQAFAQGCAAARQFPIFSMKTGGSRSASSRTVHIVVDPPTAEEAAAAEAASNTGRVSFTADLLNAINGIRLAQKLVDMPPNLLHVSSYVEEAQQVAAALPGTQIKVIRGTELRDGGFGGLWGVGKASEHPPALVILSYFPTATTTDATATTASDAKSICMVGKGIVYDTGGLSIKTPTTSMAGMKVDMGGSAAVLGAFMAAVSSGGLKAPLHALLCIAENSVDERSTRPDDILTMLSGKTVEVNNIDAEGRLVLADGVYYASQQLNPAVIVDIATLTGAQLIATGKHVAALYCNDAALEAAAVAVGQQTGDLTHPMPYIPEFWKNEFRSVVADMKNSVRDRGNAQVSCAGQFVGNHLEDYLSSNNNSSSSSSTGKWLHIDMAGPAAADERATGFGVALLSKLVQTLDK